MFGHNVAIAPAPGFNKATALPALDFNTASVLNCQTSLDLESLKSRIQELEEQLSQVSTPASSVPSVTSKPPATSPAHGIDQVKSSLGGTFDVIQESRLFGQAQAVVRSVAHKNRVFGQSHWISSFTLFRDIIDMIEPYMRGGSSRLLNDVQRAKVLARTVKAQRAPQWPTAPTTELPQRSICDMLVENYLRSIEKLYRIVHITTFLKKYEAIWAIDTQPDAGFLIQLKLILAIGATLYDYTFSMRTEATRWVYEAQTWLMSPAFKSKLGICFLQNSILVLLARELVDVGGELIWISAGAVVRSAVYMGLHKDPAQLQHMSVLDAEMRRRIWNTILEISLQSSLVSGGPCFISLSEFDTQPPGNFNDADLDAAEPAPRPSKQHTQASIAIALRQTLPARLAVVKFLNDLFSSGTYGETLRIDRDLRAAYKDLRCHLQLFPATATSAPTRFELQAVDFILHRYMSSLHVPFFSASLHEATYAYARKTVVESSLKLWSLAGSSRAITSSPSFSHEEGDLPRLCRCGSGFFRAFAFQSASLLGVELRALYQEDSISEINIRPDLLNIVEDAADWYVQCIKAGETSPKGYMLLSILSTQIDAIKRNINKDEVPAMLVKAAEEAGNTD